MRTRSDSQRVRGPVLITGGGGLIGRSLEAALRAAGTDVRCTSLSGVRTAGARLDVLDAAAVREQVAALSPALILHLAGCSDTTADPALAEELHVDGTANVLAAASAQDSPPAVVVASTVHVYERRGPGPAIAEAEPLVSGAGYGGSKARAEALLGEHTGVPAAALRLPNVYGDEDPVASRLVPSIVAAVESGEPLRLRSAPGTDVELLHADDAVAAYLLIAGALEERRPEVNGRAFNAGPGSALPIADLIAIAEEASGAPIVVEQGHRAEPAGRLRVLDSAALAQVTGWRPRVALAEGLARAIAATGVAAPTI